MGRVGEQLSSEYRVKNVEKECYHEKLSRIVINWVGFLTVCAKEFLSLWALIHYYTYQYLGEKKKKNPLT